MASETLLPCPFCGGKAIHAGDHRASKVMCSNDDCEAETGPWYANDDAQADSKAAAMWNRRAAVAELVEAGKFLLDRLVDHEVRMTSDEGAREWNGHVTPAMARFRSLLSRHQAGQ